MCKVFILVFTLTFYLVTLRLYLIPCSLSSIEGSGKCTKEGTITLSISLVAGMSKSDIFPTSAFRCQI